SFAHSSTPTILYTHREPLTFQTHVTSKRLLDAMLKLLGDVALHLQKEGLVHLHKTLLGTPTIKNVFCVFSSPWYISQTKVVRISEEKSFQVTQAYVDQIVRSEEKDFNDALKEGKYEKLFGTDIRLLERK